MAEMDFETAGERQLVEWWDSLLPLTMGQTLAEFRRAVWAECTAKVEARVRDEAWTPSGEDYDRAMHHNGDAREWARFFLWTFPRCGADEDTMTGWFANAMMAMHDGPCAKKAVDREREAAKQAWDAAASYAGIVTVSTAARDRYLARTYPAPAPSAVSLNVVRPTSPVVAAFIAPNNAAWQGRCVNVCADGSWWASPDGKTWQLEIPAFAATVEGR